MEPDAEALLAFWFGDDVESAAAVEERCKAWFAPSAEFDAAIHARFAALPDRAVARELAHWSREPRSALALVLALDQLPRNLYRGQARSFAYDDAALEAALACLDAGYDAALPPLMATFLYLPLEHAEDLTMQQRCVSLFEALEARAPARLAQRFAGFTDYARTHLDIVKRFGRFPHRNDMLGRDATADEVRYLTTGGETFGTTAAKHEA